MNKSNSNKETRSGGGDLINTGHKFWYYYFNDFENTSNGNLFYSIMDDTIFKFNIIGILQEIQDKKSKILTLIYFPNGNSSLTFVYSTIDTITDATDNKKGTVAIVWEEDTTYFKLLNDTWITIATVNLYIISTEIDLSQESVDYLANPVVFKNNIPWSKNKGETDNYNLFLFNLIAILIVTGDGD